jgi:hypothetical protein
MLFAQILDADLHTDREAVRKQQAMYKASMT